MSVAGPPQDANSAPSGGSAAAQPQAWGDHISVVAAYSPICSSAPRLRADCTASANSAQPIAT
jgi:hypothetical protein